jgi:hypothetical protein
MNKYEKLFKVLSKKGWHSWYAIEDYIKQFKKYDNWTLKDIDKIFDLMDTLLKK